MAKNRKNQTVSARFGPAIAATLCCGVLSCAGMNYVYQKNQIFELGRQISAREAKLKELRSDNERVMNRLGELTSPKSLELRSREMNLGLMAPRPEQIWRVPEGASGGGIIRAGVELAHSR